MYKSLLGVKVIYFLTDIKIYSFYNILPLYNLGLISRMILTFVHMCQFNILSKECVNRVPTFKKVFQLYLFKKRKILTSLTLFMTFTIKS